MSAVEKAAGLAQVETLAGHKRQALAELGVPRSTYYRWRRGQRGQGLELRSRAIEEVLPLLYVEGLGGLATYPSLVPETASLESALPAIAHEWVHQYLFFRPLGRKYGASYQMTTINESVADLVGNEVGWRVLAKFYGRREKPTPPPEPPAFDFSREMRNIRLKVDEMLARGQVGEAERLMEESRQLLAEHGYRLRRLNQAYFAFHGSYAESPASTSPVAGLLQAIRQRSPSLGEFLRAVAGITSYDQLERLAAQPTGG